MCHTKNALKKLRHAILDSRIIFGYPHHREADGFAETDRPISILIKCPRQRRGHFSRCFTTANTRCGNALQNTKFLECLCAGHAVFNSTTHVFFACRLFQCLLNYLRCDLAGDDQNTVHITKHDIAAVNCDLADFDGAAKIHYLGADGRILSLRTHRKNRPVLLKHHGGIAVIAVTNSTRAASSLGSCGEQLSPVGTALGAAGADINLIFLNNGYYFYDR